MRKGMIVDSALDTLEKMAKLLYEVF